MNTIIVNNFTQSGNGDRMIDVLLLAVMCKARNSKLYIRWQDFKNPGDCDPDMHPPWRFEDTKLKNVHSFFKFPSFVTIAYDVISYPKIEFTKYLGGTISPYEFRKQYMADVSESDFNRVMLDVKKDFGLKVDKFQPEVPYVAVHLRRTDKLRGVCDTMISRDRLEELNQHTRAAIQKAVDIGYTSFYVASDDPESKHEFVEYIHSIGCSTIQPENIHELLESYYDIWMISSSSLIIPSMRFSTFSLFPALFFDIPIWSVNTDMYERTNFTKHCHISNYLDV